MISPSLLIAIDRAGRGVDTSKRRLAASNHSITFMPLSARHYSKPYLQNPTTINRQGDRCRIDACMHAEGLSNNLFHAGRLNQLQEM